MDDVTAPCAMKGNEEDCFRMEGLVGKSVVGLNAELYLPLCLVLCIEGEASVSARSL